MMKNSTKRVLALAGVLALGLSAARAQEDGALLDALVKKGVLSDQEAQSIRSSEAKDESTTAADKIGISDYVKKLTFYGDVRYRWEYADEKAIAAPGILAQAGGLIGGENIIERSRVRVRAGIDAQFTDNFKGGIELETGLNDDSANQTFGNSYGKATMNLGLAYLQWHPYDWVTLTGGKMKNPLYTTDLVWDPDINPEGGAEAFSWTFPIGGGESAPVSRDPKDMKDMKMMAPSGGSDESLTVGFTAFQGIYADNNEFNGGSNLFNKTDVWQFVEQVPVQFNFNKSTYVKVAPGFDTYTSGGNSGPGNTPATVGAGENGSGSENFTAVNAADDLAIFTAPGEFDWAVGKLPMKLYWDFAWNLNGKDRIQDVYLQPAPTGQTATPVAAQTQNRDLGDNVAWLAGFQVGQSKKKGDWLVRADFRQVGLGAVDPNLNDSDWADSFMNQQGVKLVTSYNFTDFLVGSITAYDTWAYKNGLFANQNTSTLQVSSNASGTTAGIQGLASASQVQRVDVDLQWKF